MTSAADQTAPRILVAHASRHGATAGIAERLAARLRSTGLDTVVTDVDDAEDVENYDAYIIGGAAYMFHWLKPATKFARRHRELLVDRPVWLFSSGPVGDEKVDDKGNDLLEVSRPKEFDELHELLRPRDEKVFFGAWDPDAPAVGVAERMMKLMPAAKGTLPTGDFRDWRAIDTWADEIAQVLLPQQPTGSS
ncbi:MAG: flavodoxin domain-containing protein [Nitriliruptoraceae bacterium]